MRSHDIGTNFEYQIKNYLCVLGYHKTTRKLMSGAAMKDPHDLTVSPYRLKIEAKRTMKDLIRITKHWLDKYIRKDRILVFAMGNKRGVSLSERMYSISQWPHTPAAPLNEALLNMMHMVKKSIRLTEKDVRQVRSIQCGDKLYLVMKMKDYLKVFYPLTQEATAP
jgi:hypothetical protein